MNRMQRIGAGVLALVAAGLLAACGDEPAEIADVEGGLVVKGAGATFPQPVYARWIEEYQKSHPEVRFSYDSVGSGEGIKRFLAGGVDFGASDAALSDAELAKVDPARGVVMIPMTAGMVVLAYNIPGVGPGLRLPRDVYQDIFAGKIRKWNDPRIAEANPGLSLPSVDVVTVVRRDSSGTTFAFTNHLGAANPWWATQGPGIGKLVDWPGNAMTAPGNEGVARRVEITSGAIGYMGYEFANRLGLPMAILQNKAGAFVAPGPESGQAGLASADAIPADLRVFIPDPAGSAAYPIVTYTWILLNAHYADSAKAQGLKEAMGWGLDQGQAIAEELGYIPLPESMVARAGEALSRVR